VRFALASRTVALLSLQAISGGLYSFKKQVGGYFESDPVLASGPAAVASRQILRAPVLS
jgi:hypothetical protein